MTRALYAGQTEVGRRGTAKRDECARGEAEKNKKKKKKKEGGGERRAGQDTQSGEAWAGA